MAISFLISLIAAIASPLVFGFMNVMDKYVISKKVKTVLSYTALAGFVNIGIGIILSLFLDWSGIALKDMILPSIAGILFGSQFFFYFIMLKKEDVSNVIGLMYTYPLVVALLSFLFLNEVLSLIGYLGVAFIMLGIVTMSVRRKKVKLKSGIWMLINLILVVGLSEFFIKFATVNIPTFNGIAINTFVMGLTVILVLLGKKTRKGFTNELKNIRWAVFAESFTFLGIITLYVAMTNMPATIVSSIAAIQPLIVLIFERLFNRFSGGMVKDDVIMRKLIPISFIVIGVILIYSNEIVKMMGK